MRWISAIPEKCDINGEPITNEFIDGKTVFNGAWAIMCPKCHSEVGCGLGTGYGQRYKKDGKHFIKVEG